MSRGRRRKFKLRFNVKPDVVRSIISLVFLSLSLVALISFFAPSYSLNSKIQHVLRLYFGRPSIVIPLIIGSFGLLFFDRLDKKYKEARVLVGLFLLLISLSGFFHVFISKDKGYEFALDGRGGGLVGYRISNFIGSGISSFGAGILFLITLFGSLVLIFNVSFGSILDFIKNNKFLSGLREIVAKIFTKKPKLSEDGDIEIDTSASVVMADDYSDAVLITDINPEQVPIFEIIPTASEPRGLSDDKSIGTLATTLGTRSPIIPSDRIWEYPPMSILEEPPARAIDNSEIDRRIKIIKETLKSSGIDVDIAMDDVKVGPTVTQYAVKPKSPNSIQKIVSLHKSLALALASPNGAVRIEAPIPGKSLIGIEVPNRTRSLVYFKSLIDSPLVKNIKSKLTVAIGEDVSGKPMAWSISDMPHILVAGSTGTGKSVFVHSLISSILFRATPQEVKFILIDPKMGVEFGDYVDIPHLLTPVVTDMDKTPSVFKWAVEEMERRYKLFDQARARNIDDYNEKSGIQVMPYIVMVVDEFADLMLRNPTDLERDVIRIAQKGRASGVHLVLATQRPSADAITGLIRANITCRAAFRVQSQIESRVIIDIPGAEKLLGKGDMLFVPPGSANPVRIQGVIISPKETENLTNFLRQQGMEPDYEDNILNMSVISSKGGAVKSTWGEDVDDELFDEAVSIVAAAQKASSSLLQRKLRIGFARASRLIDMMEERGIVGTEVSGSKGREVLLDDIPEKKSAKDEDFGFDAEDFAGENFPRNHPDSEDDY
ncbi:DNA translocase FtsK [Patescibacteria group bacterium]|nr:DNA translocase FtsK [Patescibacteria group bacterium]